MFSFQRLLVSEVSVIIGSARAKKSSTADLQVGQGLSQGWIQSFCQNLEHSKDLSLSELGLGRIGPVTVVNLLLGKFNCF